MIWKLCDRIHKGAAAALVCLILIWASWPQVMAEEAVDLDAACTLRVQYTHEQVPIEGTQFLLYRVANADEQLQLTLTGVFADMTINPEDLPGTALRLYDRVEESAAEAELSFTTDEQGWGGTDALRPGAYLLVGQPTVQGEHTHYVDPQLVILPQQPEEGGGWSYQLTIWPKSTAIPTGIEPMDITVVKVWKDEGYEKERPAVITVRLLKNGEVFSTVDLSQKKQWTHTWTNLLPNADWSVEEAVPKGYVMGLEEWEGTFILTNSRKNIDQTGQLWWPVAVLACVGFAMAAAGILIRRSGKK